MKVTGFTFIRNASLFDYPVTEAIRSILPLCDDFVIAVGNSDDDTLERMKAIDPSKIRIIETVWDDSLREGGRVLAVETDKAYREISSEADWAFYIQGDEVVHEKYLPAIREAMERWKDHPEVDGLLFKYLHFYGSYDYVAYSSKWYRHEIRVLRVSPDIRSYRDAQGFRKTDDTKLRVKAVDAYIYHYGWAKNPVAMQRKQKTFHRFWHPDAWIRKNVQDGREYDYSGIDALERFTGTHPAVMAERIKRQDWDFQFDIAASHLSVKDRVKSFVARRLGIELGYRNYIKI
jgi:hypothetical protein